MAVMAHRQAHLACGGSCGVCCGQPSVSVMVWRWDYVVRLAQRTPVLSIAVLGSARVFVEALDEEDPAGCKHAVHVLLR